MVKPTLLVLAAGMGSRYGSLKQMDGVGPNGEAIIDYSIYDAIRAGFGKVVFVIRHLFEKEFREIFTPGRFGGQIEVDFVFQELDKLPAGFTVPAERVKPWGTNHAVMMAAGVIREEPFAVINADDFYGQEAYQTIGRYLRSVAGQKNHYCMVGYEVQNTLSDFGAVSRGVCGVDANNNLTSMVERTSIERINGKIVFKDENGEMQTIGDNTPVSMNMWGFTPDYFAYSEEYFKEFLKENEGNLKSEYFIPLMVNKLVNEGTARVKVLDTTSKWFGVTYAADRQGVVDKIQALVDAGEYPDKLF